MRMTVRMSMMSSCDAVDLSRQPMPDLEVDSPHHLQLKGAVGQIKLSILVQNRRKAAAPAEGSMDVFIVRQPGNRGSVRRAICLRKAADV